MFRYFTSLSSGPLQVTLENGPDGCSGRVEVYHEGQWGTICDDEWDLNDAQVVCRHVGCETALEAKTGAFFGEGPGQILLDDVDCNGEERSLGACTHRGYGVHDCNHSKDAGVICSSKVHVLLSAKNNMFPMQFCLFHVIHLMTVPLDYSFFF